MTANNPFSLSCKVRDYECDMQGIVNNAVYMNYLEHARHEFLHAIGLNFRTLLDKEIYLVLVHAELQFKKPLQSGQNFSVTCRIESTSKFKIFLAQEIYNERGENVLIAKITAAAISPTQKPILLSHFMETIDTKP